MEVETDNIVIGGQLVWDILLNIVTNHVVGLCNNEDSCKILKTLNTFYTTSIQEMAR